MPSTYLLDIVILLTAAVVAVPLFRAIGLGAVPGFLIAGVAVGPSGLGLIDKVTEISHLSELGVVLLLFVIGMEIKPARLWRMRRMVFGLGTAQLLVTGALITATVHLLLKVPFVAAVIIGPALALSSTAFVLQLLTQAKLLHTEYGRSSLAILLLQDLAVVPLLALIPLLGAEEQMIGADIAIALAEAVGILLLVVVGGRYLLQPVLHRVASTGNREVFTALTVLLVLGAALLTEQVGLSMAMGAFVAGLLIADSPFRHEVAAEIEPFRGLLLGLFFMSMGMSLDVGEFLARPLVSLGLLAALMVGKFAVLWPLVRGFGLRGRAAAGVALLLAQSGEFGLVLFAYAQQSELLTTTAYQQLLVVIVLSMLATPPLARLAHALATRRGQPPEGPGDAPAKAPVILAGFGRVGRQVGELLAAAGTPYVAVDNDSSRVLGGREQGFPVFYGDARRPEVIRSVGTDDARLVIVTLDDFEAAEAIVAAVHGARPDVAILARGHDGEQCRVLRELGATFAVAESLEASLDLAREALRLDEHDPVEAEELVRGVRQDYYAKVEAAPSTTEAEPSS